MKRFLATILAAAMALSLLGACGSPDAEATLTLTHTDPVGEVTASQPSDEPSLALPSQEPSTEPSLALPSTEPSAEPSLAPSSQEPSAEPSLAIPSQEPSAEPSLALPSQEPDAQPSDALCAYPLAPVDIDLQLFYDDLVFDDPDFCASAQLYNEYLDIYYPGLTAIPTNQLVVYQPMMSSVVCEIALVEVKDRTDVPAVLALLQARIDDQVGTDDEPGGAWYPASIESWKNNSRIVSNGSYIMMIAYEKCDDVVAAFDALFER